MDEFKRRMKKQERAIKRYAKSLHMNIEKAAKRWCDLGLAKQWAKQN